MSWNAFLIHGQARYCKPPWALKLQLEGLQFENPAIIGHLWALESTSVASTIASISNFSQYGEVKVDPPIDESYWDRSLVRKLNVQAARAGVFTPNIAHKFLSNRESLLRSFARLQAFTDKVGERPSWVVISRTDLLFWGRLSWARLSPRGKLLTSSIHGSSFDDNLVFVRFDLLSDLEERLALHESLCPTEYRIPVGEEFLADFLSDGSRDDPEVPARLPIVYSLVRSNSKIREKFFLWAKSAYVGLRLIIAPDFTKRLRIREIALLGPVLLLRSKSR